MQTSLAITFISGFGQGLGRPTGIETMYDAAYMRYGHLPNVVIHEPWQWNSDWNAKAAFFARHINTGNRPDRTRVITVAYSWGVGWGFQRLTRELLGRGVTVDVLVAIDAVYRLPYLPAWMWWLSPEALFGLGDIWVRQNVREVWQFRQFTNYPRGRDCVAVDRYRTLVHDALELQCRHQEADDHRDVHTKVADVIASMVAEVSQ